MKSRDAGVATAQRRSSGGLTGQKQDTTGKKKRGAAAESKAKAKAAPPTGVAAMMLQAREGARAASASQSQSQASAQTTKKPAGKQPKKPATSASSGSTTAVSATSASLAAKTGKLRSGNDLDQDSVKSRNHKLVLAPSTGAATSSLCVSNNFPSWGNKLQQRKNTAAVTASATTPDHAITDRLHEEILEYAQYTKATVDGMAVHIEEMIANVRACVLSLWPKSTVETFGSYSTGIWLPSSDVDLVILDVVEVKDAKLTVKKLRRLAHVLEKKAWVESLLVLETAKVPVLKLVSAETSVPIDITFESAATHSGLLARDLIKRYADSMPELYPLAIVFKQLLRERDLNDAYTGGLSSYSVVLMLIHFSQLWRHGALCFQAASIYASGSLPPAPSTLAKTHKSATNAVTSGSEAAKLSSPATAAPTSSYASIVSRAKTTKHQTGGAAETDKASSPEPSQPKFSYAAVAAGTAKVSEKESTVAPPVSYAAAVSTTSKQAKKSKSASAKTSSSGLARALDAVSVSSSNADTEDSSSSCSHTSAVDSDEEPLKATTQTQTQIPPVSLGEHTLLLLEFFGILFDYRKNGLSVRDGGYIYRLAENRRTQVGKPALVIEDPIHPDRNVSASSFAFSKVVAVFEDAYYALRYFRATKFAPSALSCLLSTSGHTSHAKSHGAAAA